MEQNNEFIRTNGLSLISTDNGGVFLVYIGSDTSYAMHMGYIHCRYHEKYLSGEKYQDICDTFFSNAIEERLYRTFDLKTKILEVDKKMDNSNQRIWWSDLFAENSQFKDVLNDIKVEQPADKKRQSIKRICGTKSEPVYKPLTPETSQVSIKDLKKIEEVIKIYTEGQNKQPATKKSASEFNDKK